VLTGEAPYVARILTEPAHQRVTIQAAQSTTAVAEQTTRHA
jgi:hypothetical protein